MVRLSLFQVLFRRINDGQRPQAADHEDQDRKRYDHAGLKIVLVEPDHDLAQHEDQGGISNERYLKTMHDKVFNDAPQQFDDDEHRQDIGHHHVKGRRDGLASEYCAQVYDDPRDTHQKGKDHERDHEFDHGVDDLGEVFHLSRLFPHILVMSKNAFIVPGSLKKTQNCPCKTDSHRQGGIQARVRAIQQRRQAERIHFHQDAGQYCL